MSPKRPTAGIVLAAGASARFGGAKLLADLNGKPLLAWALDAAIDSTLDRVFLVLAPEHGAILEAVPGASRADRVSGVVAEDCELGMSRSLRAGLAAARDRFPSAMFLLGDQPLVSAGLIDRLLGKYRDSDKGICVPVFRGRQGNPAVFGRAWYDALMRVEGDKGGRELIEAHPDQLLRVELDDSRCLVDVDTEIDLERMRSLLSAERIRNKKDRIV